MVIAIVQARMSSTRLPEKVMKLLSGKPLIAYIFERLSQSKRIGKIILATSVHPENDRLSQYVQGLGFDVFRGSEENVLERYYTAAKKYDADIVVRLTGDCPLIDVGICDDLIDGLRNHRADYAFMSGCFAEGLDCEAFTMAALEKSHQKARLLSEREHVTPYMRTHPNEIKTWCMEQDNDESFYRVVVDEPIDFEMISILFKDFYASKHPSANWHEIKAYLDAHPELIKMNSHIVRNEGFIKSLQNDRELPL